MKTNHLERHFASIGARFKARLLEVDPWRANDYAIDIRSDARGPYFELRVPEPLSAGFDAAVLNLVPEDRHLLLLLRREVGEGRKDRFLCGHDEREWFVAAVPGTASTVRQAKQALQPPIPGLLRLDWRSMARNPRVYARGWVRHPDHATITLREWCRVLLNTETDAPSMPRMAFLD